MKTQDESSPLNEQTLAMRTEAARAQGALQAAILFGSRARGDHHAESDWDLCIIGGACSNTALEAIQSSNSDGDWPIDMLWTATEHRLREARHGTVWAQIVQEGRVIAGDPELLKHITVKPITAQTVDHRLGQTIRKLRNGIRATVTPARESDAGRRGRMSDGTEDSANAAAGLTWVLAGFRTGNDAGQTAALEHIARRIEALNAGTRDARNAACDPSKVEEQPAWEQRLVKTMHAGADLLEGTLAARGPLAPLREHARKHHLAAVLGNRAEQAAEVVNTLLETHPGQYQNEFWCKAKTFADRCAQAHSEYHHEIAAGCARSETNWS